MTRHFTSTVYAVNDSTVILRRYEHLDIYIPPGDHIGRDELPHEADLYEVREETGLDPKLVDDTSPIPASAGRTLPQPRQQMLYNTNVHGDGSIGHQYIDYVFYAWVDTRDIDPAPDEVDPETWAWYDGSDLRGGDIDPDTVQFALEAIGTMRADKQER